MKKHFACLVLSAGLSALILPNCLGQTIQQVTPFVNSAALLACGNTKTVCGDSSTAPDIELASAGGSAQAGQGGAIATGGVFSGPPQHLFLDKTGLSSFLTADAAPGSFVESFAVIEFQTTDIGGAFDLSFRVGAAANVNGPAGGDNAFELSILRSTDGTPLNPQLVEFVDTKTGKPLSIGVSFPGLNLASVSGLSFKTPSGAISNSGQEISTGLGVVLPFSIFSDTVSFLIPPGGAGEPNDFYLFLTADANSGIAFIDPSITPDPINPNLPLTTLVPPNPNPNTPLLTPDEFAGLSPSELQQLNSIGISSPSATPEPSTMLLFGTGLLLAGAIRKRLA